MVSANVSRLKPPGHSGLARAIADGRQALDAWVSDRLVLPAYEFAAVLGVSVRRLRDSVQADRLFSNTVRGRRYYVAALLEVERVWADEVCLALAGLDDSEKTIFWLRPHGALAGRTVVETVNAGDADRAVSLARAWAAERGLERQAAVAVSQAARTLNVSPVFVKSLVSAGQFHGVRQLANGHLRIPASEVDRVAKAMRATSRRALNRLEKLTAPARQKELDAAQAQRRSQWVPVTGA